jgi:hypothetical protein
MSRVSQLDLAGLRAKLILAIEGAEGLAGSPYLLAIGALYLTASPDSPFETGLWASLFEFQAVEEHVDGAAILATLASCKAVLA